MTADHQTEIDTASRIALAVVVGLQRGEEVLIVSNPEPGVLPIAESLYQAAEALGGKPVLVLQPKKRPLDFTEPAAIGAIASLPEVLISISAMKIGKDPRGLQVGYPGRDGRSYDHIFQWAIRGERRSRGFWAPGVRLETWLRAVDIDYEELRRRARHLAEMLNEAAAVRITSPAGTDVTIGIAGRRAMVDDGDFRRPGRGGNLPAGEAFISPAVGGTNGTVVFDGTIAGDGEEDIVPDRPVVVHFRDGFVTAIEGEGSAAARLGQQIRGSEERAQAMGRSDYTRNARHLGELGIGLNPKAKMIGDLLEDEKLPNSCHLAIGSNYDEDARALTHFDCVVLGPTIYLDGKKIEY